MPWAGPAENGTDSRGNLKYSYKWNGFDNPNAALLPRPGTWLWDRLVIAVYPVDTFSIGEFGSQYDMILSSIHIQGDYNQKNFNSLAIMRPYIEEQMKKGYGKGATGWMDLGELLEAFPQYRQPYEDMMKEYSTVIEQANKLNAEDYAKWLEEMKKKYPGFDPAAPAWDQFWLGFGQGFKYVWVDIPKQIGKDIIDGAVPWWLIPAGLLVGAVILAGAVKK